MKLRIGQGFDAHRFKTGGQLVLGGVNIPYESSLIAHSDGDVVIHALCDAILGGLAQGDIGNHFPDTESQYENIDSRTLLLHVVKLMQQDGYAIGNVDITIIAQQPKLSPYIADMRHILAKDLGADIQNVSVKATTTEKMGFTGREEGIASLAVVLLVSP